MSRARSNRAKARAFALSFGVAILLLRAVPVIAKTGGSWEYVVKTNLEGDPQMALARLRSKDGSALWISCSHVASPDMKTVSILVAATVTAARFLGSSNPKGRSTVMWFDEDPPEVSHWVYRDRYGQLRGEKNVKDFVEHLVASERLVVELSNYRYETLRSEFSLDRDRTRVVADRFAKDCNSIGAKR
jgi:hypothetical protein